MKFIQKQLNKDGFTLVELIIVLAVMAIIAAIVIPRMSGITDTFRQRADQRECDNFARELELRVQLGTLTAASGTVVSVITDGSVGTPETGGTYFYFRDGTNICVYAATAAAANYAAAEALTVKAIRTNAALVN